MRAVQEAYQARLQEVVPRKRGWHLSYFSAAVLCGRLGDEDWQRQQFPTLPLNRPQWCKMITLRDGCFANFVLLRASLLKYARERLRLMTLELP